MRERLYRSRKDKMIAGVCGGMGEYFGIDSVIVRLVFVILAFIQGIGIIAYILLWIIVPMEGKEKPIPDVVKENIEEIKEEARKLGEEARKGVEIHRENRGAFWFGLGLLVLGVLILLGNYNVLYWGAVVKFWPVLLIALGIYLMVKK